MIVHLDILPKMSCRDEDTCSDDKVAASCLAIMLISQIPVSLCLFSRKYSREYLLILLRVTAGPTFFVTVIPRRTLSVRPEEYTAIKCLFWILLPDLANLRNSVLLNNLSALVKENLRKSRYSSATLVVFFYYRSLPHVIEQEFFKYNQPYLPSASCM